MAVTENKILLVSLDNVNRTPYLSRYIAALDGHNCDFFYWNRSNRDHPVDSFSQVYALDCPVDPNGSRLVTQLQKLKGYLRFRQGFKQLIKRGAYSGIIFLHSPASVLTYQMWSKSFDGRVLIDVRDYTYEDNSMYKHLEAEAIRRASTVVISSPGYRCFLPKHVYFQMHNASNYGVERNAELRSMCNSVRSAGAPIRIACIGSAKNPAVDRRVIDLFGNDSRFSLLYAGRGFGCLESYCNERGFVNIEVHDEFPSENTFDFYKGVDIVMNLYGSGSPLWDYALSNKLYLAAQLSIPILVFRNTEMARISEEYGFGIAIDFDGCNDHILGDEENLTRIPASLMGEGNSLLLRRAFEGAVVEAARRAAANYTLAVPQFYGGRIQLLLPLCLTGDKPELALTIQREDGFYAARTCLTLDMAYNNARLICRPETSWIKR